MQWRGLLMVILAATGARADSQGYVTPMPPPSAPPEANLDALLEHMVRSQLESCPGVEVHKRGRGFIAGRYGGPVVVVSASGSCAVEPMVGRPEAMIRTRWATSDPSGAEIAVMIREIPVGAAQCPTDFMTPALMRAVEPAVRPLCQEAFAPLREPFALADFFVPVLSPLGAVMTSTSSSQPVLLLERKGRTFELSGQILCQPTTNQIEVPILGRGGMRSLQLHGTLTLREPSTGAVLGQWHEPIVGTLAIGCDIAFRAKRSQRMVDAQTRWQQRFATTLEMATGSGPAEPR